MRTARGFSLNTRTQIVINWISDFDAMRRVEWKKSKKKWKNKMKNGRVGNSHRMCIGNTLVSLVSFISNEKRIKSNKFMNKHKAWIRCFSTKTKSESVNSFIERSECQTSCCRRLKTIASINVDWSNLFNNYYSYLPTHQVISVE